VSAAFALASRTAGEWVAWAEVQLRESSESPRLDAELLLAECAGASRAGIIAYPESVLSAAEADRFAAYVGRRRAGEPFAYIVGQREFFGLVLAVDARVLVPRPETELLVELALSQLPASATRVLDLGTGSGAIALALKSQRPELTLLAADSSEQALAVAQANARDLGLAVQFMLSDWFAGLAGERFDLIVSNPPYVRSEDSHFEQALAHEPRFALDGGADGLDAYRSIVSKAGPYLTPRGRLVFEHGFDQREALTHLAAEFAFRIIATADDLAGHPRAIVLASTRDG
jgi:release factor glutamine methyltransferase